jgi:hypothetical protein
VPIHYARSLLGPARSPRANRHLGVALAFVAGAINAGGFLAVHQYTSHLTGAISSAADNLALGAWDLATIFPCRSNSSARTLWVPLSMARMVGVMVFSAEQMAASAAGDIDG